MFLDVSDSISILVIYFPDAYAKISRILVKKTAKTVTDIVKLSPTDFVSNIRHQHVAVFSG